MKPKPPKFPLSKPKFGIGVVVGALLVVGTQLSGSDSAFAMVLGGGVGVALGLTGRSLPAKLAGTTSDEDESEVSGR